MNHLVEPNQVIKIKNKPSIHSVILFSALVLLLNNNVMAADVEADATADTFWLWTFLGRLHPMIVHFPISLLVIALLMEVLQWKRKSFEFQKGINLLLLIGSTSAVIAVVLGLLLINTETYGSDILPIHQWTGIVTMVLSIATVYAAYGKRELAKRILLSVTVVGVTIAGHYGASLTHGDTK